MELIVSDALGCPFLERLWVQRIEYYRKLSSVKVMHP